MSNLVAFASRRRLAKPNDPLPAERVEVFAGVSLADLKRVWADCIAEIDEAAAVGSVARRGAGGHGRRV